MRLDPATINSGKALRIWNGGLLRRRFQTGHIFARGKRPRVWVARYKEPVLDNGKVTTVLRSKVIGPCAGMSKSAARQTLQGWLRPLNEGLHTPVESVSFQEFYEKWEKDLLPTYRESTRQFYLSTAKRWILPYFQDYRAADITPSDVQRFINLFSGKYSISVLKHLRATLNCLFQAAVDWHYLKQNPASTLRLPEGTEVKRATVLLPEQVSRVIGLLSEPCRTMVMIAATAGLRESELFALKDEDFDLNNGILTIRRRLYRGKLGDVKTKKSKRELPLLPEVVEAVKSLSHEVPFLFLGPNGTGENALVRTTREAFTMVADQLGIPHFTWRSFRRSAESAMHNHGVSLKTQASMLGHSNPNMSLVYAETNETAKREAVEELGNLIFPKFSQVATGVASRAVRL
ncbi:MAG: site-specific integrase [Terriglobia bacterium]